MDCPPPLIECRFERLIDAVSSDPVANFFNLFFWPFLSVLIPVIVAFIVAAKARTDALEAVRVEIDALKESADKERADRLEEKKRDTRAESIAKLMLAVHRTTTRNRKTAGTAASITALDEIAVAAWSCSAAFREDDSWEAAWLSRLPNFASSIFMDALTNSDKESIVTLWQTTTVDALALLQESKLEKDRLTATCEEHGLEASLPWLDKEEAAENRLT
ncbi:hypothetical protein [Rathayibacter sp. AY1B7]|uniref:hypothetical protein n=1 Tax=Rathayibacter sp. AY1B7 TaxID=2080532 RepID=UPI0011B0C651|nr:hypothetical protein [Rathayibacter sp. AY1B7]